MSITERIVNPINEGNHGEKLYRITLGSGIAWIKEFKVYAYHEQEAVDLVADYIESKELEGLYDDWYGLFDLCDEDETVEAYAEAHGLTCCGNHGIYMQIVRLEELK